MTDGLVNGLPAATFYYRAAVAVDGEVSEILARALGYPDDPEYGLVTGDHTAASLALQAGHELNRLRCLLGIPCHEVRSVHYDIYGPDENWSGQYGKAERP